MSIKMYEGGDKVFIRACEIADVKPTKRQHKKFTKQERGKAYSVRQEAKETFNNSNVQAKDVLA